MAFVIFFLAPLFVIIGCATSTKDQMPKHSSLLPPDIDLSGDSLLRGQDNASIDQRIQQIVSDRGDRGDLWWGNYKRAQLWQTENPALSCELFFTLARDPLFPIQDMAHLRAKESCPYEHPIHQDRTIVSPNFEVPWLKDAHLDMEIHVAERRASDEDLRALYVKKSKLNLPRDEKVGYMEKALALAGGEPKLQKEYQARIYKLSPRLNPEPKKSDYMKVAYDFRRARDFEQAIKYYQKVANQRRLLFSKRVKALKGIRTSYKLMRDKPKYLAATEKLASEVAKYYKRARKNTYNKRLYVDTHIMLARTLWTMSRVKKARAVLKKIPRVVKRYPMDEVYWLRGRMKEEKGEFQGAIWWFEKALKEKVRSQEFEEKLRWYKAWNLRKVKKYKEAISELVILKDSTEDPYAKARFQFWLAKTYQDNNDHQAAQQEFKDLIEEDPIGYYGQLSHREISKKLNFEASISSQPLDQKLPEDLQKLLDPVYVTWLAAVGESEVARLYLNHIAKAYRKQRNHTEEGWLSLFSYFARAGHYLSLFSQIGLMEANERRSLLEAHPEILFPKPFFEHVKKASSKFGISSELIYSIMRQESAFNPRARSHADAFGLMQLIPKNAAKAAPDLNVVFTDSTMLFEPEFNILVGTAYLKQLWDKYQGRFILTTASYNASEKAIRGWMNTRYKGNVLEFIEDIPYEETRGYVKLVMRNFLFYSVLNSGGTPVTFPNWVLNLETEPETPIKAENSSDSQ